MAISENVAINFIITSQNKGLKDAQNSILNIEKLAAKAGKTFAGLFAAQKITAFAKSSVDAFMADQKALALLDQTLNNFGLGIASIDINPFIAQLSVASGVAKDELIPAFETLVRYTGNVQKAQDLLKLSMDVSAGTGKDLSTVSTALGKSYAGQQTALSKLGTGLTQAELKSNNFLTIQQRLTTIFNGDAQKAADTYAGKVNRLSSAFNEMKVSIGEGLVNAISNQLTGSIDGATTSIQNFGLIAGQVLTNIGGSIQTSGVGSIFSFLTESFVTGLSVLKNMVSGGGQIKTGKQIAADLLLQAQERKQAENTKALETYYANLDKQHALEKQIAADKAKTDAATLKAKNQQLALDKAALALKHDSKVMDLQAIENYAALQQAQSQDDKNRLMLLQALLDQNATAATNLANKVLAANGLVMDLQGNISKDPMAQWRQSIENFNADMDAAIAKAKELETHLMPPASGGNSTPAPVSGLTLSAYQSLVTGGDIGFANAALAAQGGNYVVNNTTINAIAGQDLASLLNDQIVNQSGSGVATNLSRVNSSLLGPKIS
jgi:hypothetical protein